MKNKKEKQSIAYGSTRLTRLRIMLIIPFTKAMIYKQWTIGTEANLVGEATDNAFNPGFHA